MRFNSIYHIIVQCKAPIERLCKESYTSNAVKISQQKKGGNATGNKFPVLQ